MRPHGRSDYISRRPAGNPLTTEARRRMPALPRITCVEWHLSSYAIHMKPRNDQRMQRRLQRWRAVDPNFRPLTMRRRSTAVGWTRAAIPIGTFAGVQTVKPRDGFTCHKPLEWRTQKSPRGGAGYQLVSVRQVGHGQTKNSTRKRMDDDRFRVCMRREQTQTYPLSCECSAISTKRLICWRQGDWHGGDRKSN